MTKVYPCISSSSSAAASSSSSSSSSSTSTSGKTYTIWMKSLVLNGNGYTVYDSNGKLVYRIDNYGSKCCKEVYLMDLHGTVLFSIFRKKLFRFGLWDGYKCNIGPKVKNKKPWFQVKNCSNFLKRDSEYHVTVGCDDNQSSSSSSSCYKIRGMAGKSDFNITDLQGRLVAEVKQKQSSCGVVLGEDVLSLKVEPLVEDHSFIMALAAVYGLLAHRM